MYDARLLVNVPEEQAEAVSITDISEEFSCVTAQVRELNKGNIEAKDFQREELFFDFFCSGISVFQQIEDIECLKETQNLILPLFRDILNHFDKNGILVSRDVLEKILLDK